MLSVVIVSVGKIKKPYFRQAIGEYAKRLKPYSKIEEIETRAVPFGESNKAQAKKEEGESIRKVLARFPGAYKVAMSENGEELDSQAFSFFLDKQPQTVIFVIGGALGLSAEVYKDVSRTISLSRMTLPHELARVFLYEQIYRAVTLIGGKDYHY